MATYNSTGSLMLPTKKRKADGTTADADKAFNDYVSTLPENQRDSKSFNVRRYWELNGRPANFDEAVNRGMFTMNDEDKMWHAGTVAYNQAADEYEFMKSPDHPTIGMEVDAYNNSPEMEEFRQNYYLDQSTTPWKYRRREGTGGGGNTVDRHKRKTVTDVDVNPDMVKENMELINGGASNTTGNDAVTASQRAADAANEMATGVDAPGLMTADQLQAEEERLDKKNHPRAYVRGNALKTSGQQDAELRDDLMPGQYGKVPWSDAAYVEHAIRGRRSAIPAAGTIKPVHQDLSSYDKILEYMQANQVADAAADARARRREMVASIGDAISALSSMHQTTKGAPVTYTPGADMSKVMRDRYDRMIAQRKADSDKYLNYLRVQQAREQAEENQEYRSAVAQSRKDQLEELQRHNKELEKIAADKAETDKENKERAAAEKERSNKANEEERNRHNQAVENKKSQGRGGGSSKKNKGKQAKKKVAPKRKVRQNASRQSQSSGGSTMPGVK